MMTLNRALLCLWFFWSLKKYKNLICCKNPESEVRILLCCNLDNEWIISLHNCFRFKPFYSVCSLTKLADNVFVFWRWNTFVFSWMQSWNLFFFIKTLYKHILLSFFPFFFPRSKQNLQKKNARDLFQFISLMLALNLCGKHLVRKVVDNGRRKSFKHTSGVLW